MPTHFRHIAAATLTFGFTVAVGSCGNPAAPPKPVPFVGTVRIEIIAPPNIEPGQTVKLTANAIKADGSIEDVSGSVQWNVANSAIVQITGPGVAFGKTRGETVVSVTRDRIQSSGVRIYVLPNGTFGLRGALTDSGFGVENAHVTVISGVGTGLTMMTRFGGNYSLYGVAGPVQIEVRKAGYRTRVHSIDVTAHTAMDFGMETEQPRPDFTGKYTLTISAAPCAGFPDDANRRAYTASVAQENGSVTVTLSGADLIVNNGHGNRFVGFAEPDGSINFRIGHGYLYYADYIGLFDIVERLEFTVYMASGTVNVTGTPQRMSGALDGTLHVSARPTAPFLPSSYECRSKNHGFEMVRQ